MTLSLNEDSIPVEYRGEKFNDEDFEIDLYTRFNPDEKEIKEVFIGDRAGWLVPILSMVSREHDYFENEHFRKIASTIYSLKGGKEFDDSIYFLICTKKSLGECGISALETSMCLLGFYRFIEEISQYESMPGYDCLNNRINLKKTILYSDLDGFWNIFYRKILPLENNLYARFMYFYQFMEMFMDMLFHCVVAHWKERGRGHASIRTKITELNSERKLINLLYSTFGINSLDDIDAAQMLNRIIGELNDKNYENNASRADSIYDFRNLIVHNYYRLSLQDELKLMTGLLEKDVFRILEFISIGGYDYDLKAEIESRYLS